MSDQQRTLTIQEAKDLALEHHAAGRLPQAANIYQEILKSDPEEPIALNLLGLVAHQMGNHEAAVDLIGKALTLKPSYAEAHNNLGSTLQALKKPEEALGNYRKALDIKPDYAEALYNMGVAFWDLGKATDAIACYQKALAIQPGFAPAYNNLGLSFREVGQLEEALASYQRAISIKPNYAEAHSNLGNALMALGRINDAIAAYRNALEVQPNFAQTHNNLGMAFRELGKPEEAMTSYQKAISLQPDYAEAHHNFGTVLQEIGRPKDAISNFEHALAVRPDYVEAHNNLGICLQESSQPEKAAASYRRALVIRPDYAEVHNNLGVALQDCGRMKEAETSYRKALAIKPNLFDAHNNLGLTLERQGNFEDALISYQKGLGLKPNDARAHNNIGRIYAEMGQITKAIESHRRAVSLSPKEDLFWATFANSLSRASFASIDENLYRDLLKLLEHPTVRPAYIVQPIISALRHHPGFAQILEATNFSKENVIINYNELAKHLSEIPLFLRILELSTIADLKIERMLTVLRASMLQKTKERNTNEETQPFAAALALHCFTSEYVFAETSEEKTIIENLHKEIERLLKNGQIIPESFVLAVAAYRPLYSFPWAQTLSKQKWLKNVKNVVTRQITEPLEEQSLREKIPSMTPIQNTVSQLVREQYEENPYPRWITTDLRKKQNSIGFVLQNSPLFLDLAGYISPRHAEILVAGCGTGQQALITASRFLNKTVLAVDLSLKSLSYAARKTNELNVPNIEYAQADIMELRKLERQFDLIECSGVLHHLDDPIAGWKILVDLLRPGGLMQIGLYSEIARQNIVGCSTLIAETGYSSSPEDIRRCRQDLISLAADGNPEMVKVCTLKDFFNMSECRDMLFHVQEHRFTLPQIEKAMTSLNLEFLGFEMRDKGPMQEFKNTYPGSGASTSLELWHKFELKNPDTFSGMYQIWCKKN